jgi:hypothetical protein
MAARPAGGEAQKLTDVKGDIAAFRWSPICAACC